MLDPLADQHLALATEATAVLFLGGRRFHHRTHSRFTALVCQQRANQRLSVDPVSLRTPAPTGCRDRGRGDLLSGGLRDLVNTFRPGKVTQPIPGLAMVRING